MDKEGLERVGKFAENLGFKSYIRDDGTYAAFDVCTPISSVCVYYEYDNPIKNQASVSIYWTSCERGNCGVEATKEIIKKLECAAVIAGKLNKESESHNTRMPNN